MLGLMHAEAPALEEALRAAGSGRDISMVQNPAFDTEPVRSLPANQKPALSAVEIHVRPKRSSLAVLSKAGNNVRQSVVVSAGRAAGLTVGMVS